VNSKLQGGAVDVKPLITHTVPLECIAEAFETVAAYDDGVLKAVIRPDRDTEPTG
jgi:threonine dehydrogenase-like Zn-dependent dehydrogenase